MTMMKSSNTEWLGDIPAEWDVAQIGNYYELRNEKVSDYDFEPLSVTMKGIVPQLATAAKSDDHSNRKLVKKGDFVINSRSDRRGSCGISPLDGSVSLINTVMEPRGEMNPQYYNWLFHTEQFADEFYKWGHGIVDDLWTTRWQEMKKILIVAPSPDEQQAIADYLDETCSKIDEIIAEAKASIDEYKELKQSVIFEAVTKGLDKNVEFIDSGDEWLGKYPQSYNIGQLSMLSNIVRGGSPRPAGDPRYYGGNISFMRIADITKDDNIYVNSCENTITEEGLTRTRMIPPNTLLLTNSGATLGVPKIDTFETAFNDGIAAFLDLDERLNIVYVYFFLKARTSYFLECASMGMGQPNLNTDIIGRTKIVFPTLVEQQKVISYLEDRCGKLNSLISEKESLIKDLESYKKSLIYEVVTGKRRVV